MNQLKEGTIASIGEAISHELGVEMVKNYRKAFPGQVTSHQIGIDILRQILAQPGCEGIRFYNAINEYGEETLVYVGVDASDKVITEYTIIGDNSEMVTMAGIIGDRLKPGPRDPEFDELFEDGGCRSNNRKGISICCVLMET